MRTWVLCLVVLGASVAALGAQQASVVYDVTALVGNTGGIVSLSGGKEIDIASTWSRNTRVLFEDKMPGANWEHPASLKVIDGNGALVNEIAVRRPPQGLNDAPVIAGELPNADLPKFNLNTFEGKHKVANPDKFKAILINGMADQRHWNDFSFLYRTLIGIYGYKRENIIVVDGVNKERQPDLDGDGTKDIQYTSTQQGIRDAMAALKEQVKPGDQLILAINDHGGKIGNESTIVALDGEMKVSEFSKLLKDVKADRVLSLYEQCYSGGFVRPSTARGRVSMSAARDDEYSWASSDLLWDAWIYQAIVGFAMQTHDGQLVTVDSNRDGRVSAAEAFAYSVANDKASESPLLESHSNSGDALNMGLGF